MAEWTNERMNAGTTECRNESMEWKERMKDWMNAWMIQWNERKNWRCRVKSMHSLRGPKRFTPHRKRSQFTRKNTGFRAQSVFKPEFMRSRSLTLPNYLHDAVVDTDVVDMMIEMVFQWKSSSRYSLVRILPTSSSKVARSPAVFLTFSSGNGTLKTVSCTFCRPHLPKMLRTLQFFKTFSSGNRALATVSCTYCRPHLPECSEPSEPRQFFTMFMWNEPSLQSRAHFVDRFFRIEPRTRRNHFTRKTQGFAP